MSPMKHLVIASGLLVSIGTAALLSPRAVDCAFSTPPSRSDTCDSFASSWGLSVDELTKLNPGLTCPGTLDITKSYCVIGTITDDPPTPTTTSSTTSKTTTSKTSSTTTSTGPTNSPTMPGLAPNCDGFYKVSSGDTCDAIAKSNGITTAQFKSWNTEINDNCSNLWLSYYVCVHVPGATTTTTSAQPTPTGPTPQMPGIVAKCKRFYQVQSGDSCWSISQAAGVTVDQFLTWNTAVDSNCSNLWLGYYVCTGV